LAQFSSTHETARNPREEAERAASRIQLGLDLNVECEVRGRLTKGEIKYVKPKAKSGSKRMTE
jgi:hypothetical protein